MKAQFNLVGIITFSIIIIAFFIGLWLGTEVQSEEYDVSYESCFEKESIIEDRRIPVFMNVTEEATGKIYLASLYIEEEIIK